MAVEVILPRVDMDMTAGKIGQWFFDEGARVEKGQPLFEIETDKAAMEIEAPASGVLRGVAAKSGDELPVGSVVGWIYAPDEPYDAAPAGTSAPPVAEAAPPAGGARAVTSPSEPAARQGDSTGLRATPMARRIARRAGVDLTQVAGAGPRGRIQARDVANRSASTASADHSALSRVWLARGTGAPLVLIHGFGADLNGWRPMVARLSSDRPILALDLPGHGNSKLAGAASFEALVEAIEAALVEERVAAAHLVGHSLGGAVASALAERRSVEARSLMLVAPAGLGPDINGAFIAGFLRARSEASLAPWMRLLATDEASLGSAMVKTTLRQRADLDVGEAQAQIAAALFPDGAQAFSVRDRLARIAVPAKVVFGLDDQIIPPRHARGLPGMVGAHLFPGVGHMPHFEARGEVARLVAELAAAGG
jgi:pyruvate dehydrogenase E2 component (dihydrolipoamide acetyltransferase)